MKKIIIITALLFWGNAIIAQSKFTTVQLPSKIIENYWVLAAEDGSVCIQYYKKPYLYFHLIDRTGSEVEQIKEPFKYRPEIFSGNYSDGYFNFYYRPRSRKKEGDVGAFIVDAGDRVYNGQRRYDIKATNSEDIIGDFSADDAVYLLLSIRNSPLIRIARLDGSEEAEVRSYNAPALLEKAFSPQQPFLFVNPLAPKSVYSFQANKKIYYQNDQFYFTFDHPEQFKTHIWQVDWEQDSAWLVSTPKKKLVFGRSSNSYLHNDQLYRFTVDQVKVDLSIYDLNSGDSLATLSHTGETQIPFKTGPIHFIDEYGTQHKIQQMRNDKLFKTFSNGSPSVFVEQVNSANVKVTMGSFNATATGLSIGGGFGSFGRVGGVAIGGSQQLTGTRRGSTFIHSYLSYPDFSVTDDSDLLTPNERIFRYLDRNRRNVYLSKVYEYDEDRIHLAYIDNNEAKLHIMEFSR